MEHNTGYYTKEKRCTKCKEVFSLTLFKKDKRGYHSPYCEDCKVEYMREYNNRPGVAKQKWSAAREKFYPKKFNITLEEYEAMSTAQNHKCSVCGESCRSGKRLAVDHDHACCAGNYSCGECIRGLLCFDCNSGVNKFKDSPTILRNAAEYLESYESKSPAKTNSRRHFGTIRLFSKGRSLPR